MAAFIFAPYLVTNGLLTVILIAGAIFGLGYGAYLAVDWALVADVLPSEETFARDMGVWNIGLTLPQVLAAVFGGWLIGLGLALGSLQLGYTFLFVGFVVFCVSGTVTVRYIKGGGALVAPPFRMSRPIAATYGDVGDCPSRRFVPIFTGGADEDDLAPPESPGRLEDVLAHLLSCSTRASGRSPCHATADTSAPPRPGRHPRTNSVIDCEESAAWKTRRASRRRPLEEHRSSWIPLPVSSPRFHRLAARPVRARRRYASWRQAITCSQRRCLISRPKRRQQRRERLRAAFRAAVDCALERRAQLFVIAGNLFASPAPENQDRAFVAQELARLHEAGVACVAVAGPRDAGSATSDDAPYHLYESGDRTALLPAERRAPASAGRDRWRPCRAGWIERWIERCASCER